MTFHTIINNTDLLKNLNKPNWVIFDCRFKLGDINGGRIAHQKSHIPNAIYVHLDADLSNPIIPGKTGRHPLPDISILVEKLSKWGVTNETQVVIYDDKNGAIAARLWWLLNWLGHEQVAVLNGGWENWIKKEYPISNETPIPIEKTFQPLLQKNMTFSKKEIGIRTKNNPFLLVDSRTNDRYLGFNETRDPIAGHIPEAINLPFAENVNKYGLFLSKTDLQKRFEPLKDSPNVVFYCGSGVTACHNILAVKHCGLGQATLYPGSWSEWINGF